MEAEAFGEGGFLSSMRRLTLEWPTGAAEDLLPQALVLKATRMKSVTRVFLGQEVGVQHPSMQEKQP